MKLLLLLALAAVVSTVAVRVAVFELRPSKDAADGWEKNLAFVRTKLTELALPRDQSIVVLPEYGIVNDLYLNPMEISTASKLRAACNWVRTVVVKSSTRSGNAFCTRLDCTEAPTSGPAAVAMDIARSTRTAMAVNLLTKFEHNLYNAEFIFTGEGRQAYYLKQKPIPAESSSMGLRIVPGDQEGSWQLPASLGGVPVGLLICFDIVFPLAQKQARTKNIKHFIFSTEWESKQELYSLAVQQAFSRITQTHLFASNVNNVRTNPSTYTATGSSIIRAGRVQHYHAGPLPGDPLQGAFGRVLVQEVDFAASTTAADPAGAPFDDHPDLIRGVGPTRARNANGATEMRFVHPGAAIPPELVLNAGDLECKFLLTPREGVNVPHSSGVAYVLRAQNGRYAGRNIRSCTMLAIPHRYANRTSFRHWNTYNLDIPFRFSRITIESNVHGENVATLPLVLLMDHSTKIPKPVLSSQSTFKINARRAQFSDLVVNPGANDPVAIVSVYGVVDNEQAATVTVPQDGGVMGDELPVTGDSVVYTVATGGETLRTCTGGGAALLSVKDRFRRAPKSLAPQMQ